jgi:hypothetical protein
MSLRIDSVDDLPEHIRVLNRVSVSGRGRPPAKSPGFGKSLQAAAAGGGGAAAAASGGDSSAAFLASLPPSLRAGAVVEFKFHPDRRWRFDVAWPDRRVAFEIEGGIWLQTKSGRSAGHAHPDRFIRDIDKYNTAAALGWRVFRVTPDMIRSAGGLYWALRALGDPHVD